MKRATTIIAVLLFIALRTVSAQGWATTGGPEGANVIGITSTPTKLVVGANNSYNPGGVWLSPINGGNWVNVAMNMPNKKVIAIGTLGETLFVSNTNHYNEADGGTYRSEDGGLTWEQVRSLGLNGYDCFNCFYSRGDTIYAGSESSGVYRSYDNGTTWENSVTGLLSATVLCFTSIGDTIYIGTQKGVYYSIDGAITWIAKNNGISTTGWNGRILSITTIGDTIYAANYNKGVFKSTYRGDSWTTVNNGISDLFMNAIYAKGSSVYASNSQGVLKMNNGGASWTTANQGIPAIKTFCFYNQGSRLIAGGQAGLFETTNNGANWIEANTGLAGHTIGNQFNSHEIIINADQYMFLGTSEGRIYRSADQGTTWQFAGNGLMTNDFITSLFYINQTLYACYSSSGSYRSFDWGDTWEPVTFPFSGPIQTLIKNNRIWACSWDLNYSDDFGATWNIEGNVPAEVFGICDKLDDLFVISKMSWETETTVYKSNYGTEPFTYMGGIPGVICDRIFALGDTLFVASQNGGIYQSIDDGVTWTTAGLSGQIIKNYAVSGNNLFVRTRSTIYIRNNANSSWVQINSNLPPVLDDYDWYNSGLHATADKLYAGISSLSLYEADMANFSIPSQPSPIVGATAPCIGSSQIYSVTNVPDITYAWQFPAGWIVTTGGTTSSVTVTVGATTGLVLVTPSSILGTGPAQYLIVTPAPILNASALISVSQNDVCAGTSVTYTPSPVGGGITPSYEWFKNAVSTATSETYTHVPLDGDVVFVVMTSNSECSTGSPATSNSITMNVVSVPDAAAAVSGQSVVCSGTAQVGYDVAVITGADSYVWALPAGASIVSGDGTNAISVDFSASAVSGGITVAGHNLCGNGIISAAFNVTVNSTPPTPVISQIGITLSSNAPTGNQWYKNGVIINGATATTYEVTENATYSSIITINGCSSEPSNSLVVVNVGITNPSAGQFEIFPVPSDGLFTAILASPSAEIFTIRVFNNIGILVFEKKDVQVNGTANQTIDLRPVPSGIYTVTFTSGTSQVVRKIMIKQD